jgi:endoglucanase
LALGKLLAASSSDTTKPPSLAADNNITTYWASASGETVWLRVDLGVAQAVGRVVVRWKDAYYAKAYEIQVSNDGTNWTAARSISAGGSEAQDLTFAQRLARFVQISMTSDNKGTYRILEFEVYSGSTASMAKRGEIAEASAVPSDFVLEQNYPNPFSTNGSLGNAHTQIRFGLPQASHVTIRLYTINGLEVRKLVDAEYSAGMHTITFHARNLPSGTYFYAMQAGAVRKVRQLMLLK